MVTGAYNTTMREGRQHTDWMGCNTHETSRTSLPVPWAGCKISTHPQQISFADASCCLVRCSTRRHLIHHHRPALFGLSEHQSNWHFQCNLRRRGGVSSTVPGCMGSCMRQGHTARECQCTRWGGSAWGFVHQLGPESGSAALEQRPHQNSGRRVGRAARTDDRTAGLLVKFMMTVCVALVRTCNPGF